MKAITIHQPWASLVGDGRAPFLGRAWAPPQTAIGARIAIHAAARRRRLDPSRFGRRQPYPFGAVVCTAVLAGAYCVTGLRPIPGLKEQGFDTPLSVWECGIHVPGSPWGGDPGFERWPGSYVDDCTDCTVGCWLWWLTDIEPMTTPSPARGRPRLWEWTPARGQR